MIENRIKEKLGDIIRQYDTRIAIIIYIQANSLPKVLYLSQ